ncbi:hypothetical protein [Hymenobacter glacialis]|uniref:Glycosyltransferase RgtA/B/C/D-like domain-containing protein n=1 Tax=Hymenobacter glacialis TaxID=1908236 RepID=A0A1G1TBZ0_9BACT|nr:hypothetical protein [Hymenobacter glacialis]OGX88386.1 hypothetical protein BEN48_09885 [Hymenobacter glacialis]
MKPRFSHPYSLLAILILFLLMVQARLWAPYWDTHNVQAILTWDAMGYYIYLPAQFIYHDLGHMGFANDIMREYNPSSSFYQAFQVPGGPEGQLVTKYTCGLALLWTPFFLLGHWAAAWLDYPQDGFSPPYQIAIAFGGLLFALLGLGLLRRVLLRYFSDVVTTLVLVLLVLGSNYFQYAVFDAAMAHNYLFTGYALLLWLTIRWHERPTRGGAFAIGLTVGILVLIRPSEAVAAVVPLLWGVGSVAAARAKLALLRTRWADVPLLVLGGVLGVLPQVLYWHWATGHFIFYSYGDQHFSFLKPHVWQVLFSFKKGWLIYSPLLLLPLAGLVVLWRTHRAVAVPVLAFVVLNLWVVSAWDIWWYGGSIGQRALVQSYAVLALPWAAAVAWLLAPARRPALKAAAVVAAVLLVDLNLFQHWQYMRSIIHPEEMNNRYYFAVFNNTMPTQADFALLDVKTRLPKAERFYRPQVIGKLDFENQPPDAATGISADMGYYSRQSFRADAQHAYGPALTIKLADAGLTPGQYVRASCRVYSDYGAWGNKLVMSVERDGKNVVWNAIRLQNNLSLNRSWNLVHFDAPIPAEARLTDILKIYVLSENASGCYIDDVQAEWMKPSTSW